MQKAGIKDIAPSEDPYMLSTFYSRAAGGRALYAVLDQTVDLYGEKTGMGLREALAPVASMGKDAIENWKDYAIARRALDLYDRGIEFGIPKDDAKAVVDKYRSPVFDSVLNEVTDWSRRIMSQLVQAGRMTQEEFDQIVELNPVYVPFSRQFEDGEIKRGRNGSGKNGRGVYKIKGSGREIHDPIEALVMQAENITDIAMQADILRSFVRLHDSQKGKANALGTMISEVSAPQEVTEFSIEKIKKDVAQKAIELGADPDEVAAAMLDVWDERMTVFTNATEYKGKDNIVSIVVDGKRRFFEMSPELAQIVEGTNKTRAIANVLGDISRWAVGVQRLGATGLNPAFGAIRNLVRDTLTATVTSDYHNHIPLLSTWRGMYEDIRNTESAELYHSLGLDLSGRVGQDMTQAKNRGKRATATTRAQKIKSAGAISGLRELIGHSEVGPRLMEFKDARDYGLEKFGSEKDANILAGCAAKDVTVNFTRAGSVGQQINEVVMFYNASIQSVDKAARAFGARKAMPWAKEQSRLKNLKRSTIRATVSLTSMALLNYFRNRDEDWWKDLPPYEKWNYLHIKSWKSGPIARIPLPFEIGAIFGAIPIAMLEERRTPGSLKEALAQFGRNVTPIDVGGEGLDDIAHGVLRTAAVLTPFADMATNKDWKGDYIVNPTVMKNRERQDWYDSNTTELMKALGRASGQSPAQLEHMINTFSGGLYLRAYKTLENMAKKDGISLSDPSSIPVAGTLFLRKGTNRTVGEFYDSLDVLRRKKGSGTATLAQIGELSAGERLKRQLTSEWDKKRDSNKQDADEIYNDIISKVKDHNNDDFKKLGAMSILYAATSPSAEADDKDISLVLGEYSVEELASILRAAVKRRGGSVRIRTSTGKLTAYGERLAKLKALEK